METQETWKLSESETQEQEPVVDVVSQKHKSKTINARDGNSKSRIKADEGRPKRKTKNL